MNNTIENIEINNATMSRDMEKHQFNINEYFKQCEIDTTNENFIDYNCAELNLNIKEAAAKIKAEKEKQQNDNYELFKMGFKKRFTAFEKNAQIEKIEKINQLVKEYNDNLPAMLIELTKKRREFHRINLTNKKNADIEEYKQNLVI